MVFSGVCSRAKWEEKNESEKQNIWRSPHRAKCKPIMASICLCQRFYCSTLRGKQQTVVDIVSRSLLHDPVAEPFDIFSTLQTQIFELKTGYMVSHSERSPEMWCRMGFTVTCDSRTALQETESLWERPFMRVLNGSKQLPIKKGRLLCLCDKYRVKYRHDPLTNLTVGPIVIAWWLVYKPDGRVGCVTYSYTDEMKRECLYK